MVSSDGPPLRYVMVLEDEGSLRRQERRYLTKCGLSVAEAHDLDTARTLLEHHHFDVVLVDLHLGTDDGMDLVRELSQTGTPPVIITSGCVEEVDRVLGLELGADDYLVKPFSLRELYARIKAVHRRATHHRLVPHTKVARFGEWTLDLALHQLSSTAGEHAWLTRAELAILRVLLENTGVVVRRQDLLALARRDDAGVFERTVDVLISRLRHKLEHDVRHPQCIETIRGEGYRFALDVNWGTAPPLATVYRRENATTAPAAIRV